MSEPAIRPAWTGTAHASPAVVEATWRRTMRRWFWIPLLIVFTALATAFVVTSRQTPLYQSATTIAIAPSAKVADPNDVVRSLDTLERRTIVTTLARIAATRDLLDQAAATIGTPLNEARANRVSGTVLPNTSLLRITVEGTDRQRAADLANAIAVALGGAAARLYRVYDLNVVAKATPADRPFFPDPARNYAVAVVAGLVAAGAALFVIHRAARGSRSAASHASA